VVGEFPISAWRIILNWNIGTLSRGGAIMGQRTIGAADVLAAATGGLARTVEELARNVGVRVMRTNNISSQRILS
jgi:hypothetical protein